MANTKTKSKGTRVAYHLTPGTVHAAIAAGGSLDAGWVQIKNIQDVDPKKNVITDFDDGDLEDAVKIVAMTVEPGMVTFTKRKSSDTTSQSVTLQGLCDGATIICIAVLYADGTIHQSGHGFLRSTSGGKAADGDLKAKATESYEFVSKDVLTVTEHA